MIPGTGRALGPLLLLLALLQCAARRWAVVKRSVPDVCATCHIHATCHQIEGKSVCICNYGFVGNGRTHCQDIDECEESGLCGHNAKCVNTEGSYKCYCNDGYKLENGERSFHPDGNTVSCREIGCGSPPEMKHGYVVGNYSLLPGSAVHYECKEGFYSNEGKSSYCTANETWEPATLSCKGVDCGVPPSVLNAHPASVSGTTYGSEVTYNCVHGYFMASGNKTAVCNAEGQWDGTDLVCKEIDCGKPLLIPHTEMTWDNSTTLRSRVYYRCKGGYYFNGGRNFSECTIDQSWENITFICKEEELFSNLSIFNETCVKWERKTGRLGVQKTYTFRILGQRWDEKTFSEDVIFNITTNEDNPKVCLDLDSGSNYVVNITTISSTNIPVSVTVAVQTKVKEPFNNVLIFNDTCLKWQRNVRGTDVEDRYSFHVQGQRWYQKEFFHEMIFDLTTHKQAPEVCFDLQPGTNYSVNISMAALNFSLLVSMTTQITDPPFPDVEFVAVTGSAPLLRLRKAEDQNGPISFYQVIVLPLDLQSTFICDSFAAATFFSNATDVKGYVAAEFQAKDVADNMPISLGDRHYYGKFYNAPLKLGEEYCVFLRVISEWNKVRTQSCAIWAQIKNLAPMPQYMTAVGLGSVAAVCLILFLTFSAARSYLHNTVSSPPAALACEAVYLSATMDTAQLGFTSSFLETENVSLL
ncbi:sushi domain-containing protein 1 isoform 4-T4 [Ara ararauna]